MKFKTNNYIRKLAVFAVVFSFVFAGVGICGAKTPSEDIMNVIPIAMATDNNYVVPTIVAITSMLENKNDDTYLKFHLMLSGTVSDENKCKMKVLENLYENCSVELIDMKDKFSATYISPSHITTPTYYRLCLPSLLPQYDKILYLDGDIVVTRDLWGMYCTDLSDCYIGAVKGFGQQSMVLEPRFKDYPQRLGVKDMTQCINAGVLIINLKQMRVDRMEDKFNNFIPTLHERNLTLNDQDVLNATCYDKIKFLSPIYNAFQHITFSYKTMSILVDCYDLKDFKEACENPVIIHYTSSDKPWKNGRCRFYDKWNEYFKIAKAKIGDLSQHISGTYKIVSALSDKKVIDISRASNKNEANVHIWESNGTNAQKFNIKYILGGYYEIESMCSGKVLDVVRAGKSSGTNVWQYERNGTDAQKWIFKNEGNGYYCIISECNGLCLDVSGANTQDGTNIQVSDYNGGNGQKFKLVQA